MKITKLLFLMLVILTPGCGVRFANAPVNMEIPETFTKRAVYPGGVAGYEFQDLVGNILYLEPQKDPIRIDVIRQAGYISTIIPITDSNNFYRSRIQNGAQAQGSYLAFAANLKADEMAELTLDDIARCGIELKEEATWIDIKTKLTAWVTQHPKQNPNASRVWIKAVVISRRVYNYYTSISANASGQVGEVTGVKTGVYRKDENGIRSVILGFEAFDIDMLVAAATPHPTTRFNLESLNKEIQKTAYFAEIAGKITGTLP